jgi:hypothetical protein
VLAGNSLRTQSTFILTLTCTLDSGYSSSSRVTVTTNSPPFGGVLDVSPGKGSMLETMFSLFSSGWADEDLPLSMHFGYLTSSADDLTVFRSRLPLSYTSTLLPSAHSGVNGTNSNLTCVVVVFDSLDSSSRSLSVVSVESTKMSVEDLSVLLLNGINGSKLSSNTDDLKNILSSTATVLNRVNCSGSPDCRSLNREDCSLVEGTCGECLSGSVGLAGASNTRCLFGVSATRRLTPSNQSTSSPLSCESDVDCANELFHECNVQSKVCLPIAQSCPNSCSGHGKCLFVSRYDPNVTFTGCGLLDVECVSVCDCEESHMGLSCSTPRPEFLKTMDLRQLLIESVGDLMARENADRSSVKSWIRSLSSVGSDSLSFSAESKRAMSALVIQILATSQEVGLSTEDLRESRMDAVLDICISGLSLSDPESETLLVTLLREHSALITSDMSDDQYPVTSVSSHLRSSSFALSSPTSPQRLSIPGTALESLSSMTHQSIELSSGILFPVQLTVAEVQTIAASNNSSANSSQLSLPLIVSFGGIPCSTSGGDCKLSVLLQNKLTPARLIAPAASSLLLESDAVPFQLDCVRDQVADRAFLCPSGDSLILSCNGSFSGTVRRLCPVRSIVRTCETSVMASPGHSSREIHCELSDGSNESTTICVCNLTDVGDMGPVSFSILSLQKSVLKEFVSTWESSSSLSSAEVAQSWVVLATVGGLGALFTVFILVSAVYDWSERQKISTANVLSNQLSGPSISTRISRRKRNRKRILFVGVQERPRANQDLKLIDESLPSIFRSDSLWVKFKEEMRVYHRWLGIVFYYSPEFPRSMRLLSLFSSIVIMLFVQSVTYSIADPDDGSCEACKDENCCLSLRSTLNSNEDQCYWMSQGVSSTNLTSSPEQGSCRFRDLGEDMTRMFIVAMISAVVSAPFALSFQYLIANVLSKATISGEEEEEERQRYQQLRMQRLSAARAVSPADSPTPTSRDLVEECGASFEEDYSNLLRELSEHYNTLTPGSTKAKELRGKFPETLDDLSHLTLCSQMLGDLSLMKALMCPCRTSRRLSLDGFGASSPL